MKQNNKLSWLIVFLFVFGAGRQLSAQSLKDVFNSSETPVFYLGVDFTLAKLIDGYENELEIRDRNYPAINDVIVNEPKRYDLAGAFHKSSIDHDLSLVAKRNARMNAEEIKSSNSSDYTRLKEADINKLVRGFDFGGKKGIGLLFIVEGMNKTNKRASIWVTLINMGGKKVLNTERMEGKARGFGFRNYWAAAVRDIIEDIDGKKYKEWKSKYGG